MVRFTIAAVVPNCSGRNGTTGVYMSSESGQMMLAAAKSSTSPPMPKRGCGTTSQPSDLAALAVSTFF